MSGLGDITHDWLRLAATAAALLSFAALCLFCLRKPKGMRMGVSDILVVYASQTGQAQALATQANARLRAAGMASHLASLADITPEALGAARLILAVVSTTGEGDAPDEAVGFERRLMSQDLALPDLRFAVLALGDRKYAAFGAFGLRVDQWLRRSQACALSPCLFADDLDAQTLATWDNLLSELGAASLTLDDTRPMFRLTSRVRVNPSSVYPLHRVILTPLSDVHWSAGDLAEIRTSQGALRDYSIASLSSEGHVELLIREVRGPDGTLGKGSQYILDTWKLGEVGSVNIRKHVGFHTASGVGPLILIGAGTGFAGLRPHLLKTAHRKPWMIFGERNSQQDAFAELALKNHLKDGQLDRLDLAYSRPLSGDGRYVQDVLKLCAGELHQRLSVDGGLMVCGNLAMGRAVDAVIRDIMGTDWVDEALRDGHYRRDLY